ncbi:MAG: hypothetical protein Q4A17_09575, partial [Thermoguttaceae bacterium]|nr:hypothetical protein [Thermoguttaceae bacterium]
MRKSFAENGFNFELVSDSERESFTLPPCQMMAYSDYDENQDDEMDDDWDEDDEDDWDEDEDEDDE